MKLLKFFGVILSFCLSIVLLVIIILYSSILFIKNSITEESINNYITKIDVFSISADDIFKDKYTNDETLKDVIIETLEEKGVSQKITLSVLEKPELINISSKYLSSYISYIILNKDKPVVVSDDIYNIVDSSLIEKSLERSLTEKEKTELSLFITSTTKAINDNILDRSEIVHTTAYDKAFNFIFSDNFNICIIILFIVLFLLFCLFTWSFYKPFIYIGISSCICGVFYMLIFVFERIFLKYFINNNGAIEEIIKKFGDMVALKVLIMGSIILMIGIIFVAIYKLFKSIFYKEIDPFDNIEEDNRVNPKIKAKKLS